MKSYIMVNDVGNDSISRMNKLLQGIPGGAFKAAHGALKRAGSTAQTRAGQYAAAEYTITKGTFDRHTHSKLHVDGGIGGVSGISISFSGYTIPLLEFKTNYGGDGRLRTAVLRGNTQTALERAFVGWIGANRVFERVGKDRFPVQGLYGPSTGHMMANEKVTEKMERTVAEVFDKRLEHEMLRVMNGWGG